MAALVVTLAYLKRSGVGLPARADRLKIVGLGILGNVIYQFMFIFGLANTRAGTASVLLAGTPIVTGMLSALVGHEHVSRRVWIGAAATVVGISLVVFTSAASPAATENHLVGNLLEFTSTRTVRCEPFPCDVVIEDALRYTADLRLTNRVAVEWRPSGACAVGDAELVRPVLLNLIRNAVQAMPDGGTLTIQAEPAGDAVVLAVADTGPGIPAAEAERIFKPFFTTKTKGTGLGLTVARGLVTAMGGRLALGAAAGGGARFTLALPAAGVEGRREG